MSKALVFAHRGFSGKYPENTMLAFRKAVEAGCDGIELDVHLTRDGVLVVTHDEDIRRVTDGRGMIRDYTFEELRRFDASGPYTGQYGFNPIPSLEEYFEYVKDLPVVTNIEMKNSVYYYSGLEQKTIAMVRRFHLEDRIIFSSFNHPSMLLCKTLAPEIKAGLLWGPSIGNSGGYVRACGVDYLHPEIGRLTEEEIANCEAHGVGINAWTVNDPNTMRYCIHKRLHGIITNHPDVCRALLG